VLKKDIGLGFDLLSDILLHPHSGRKEIARKKQITKNRLFSRTRSPASSPP